MARGITDQDVFDAADRLLGRGERPTIERVRQEIGRGSPNTVNPLLDQWWMNLSKRMSGAPIDSLPVPIRLATEALYREVLRQAEQFASESVSALREQVERDREAVSAATEHLQAERSGAQALSEAVRQELGELRATNERLNNQISSLMANLEVERRDAAQARLAAHLAEEERRRTAEASIAEVGRVRDQWQGNERHWLKEIENLREDVKRLRREAVQELGRHQKRVTELQADAASKASDLKERLSLETAQRLAAETALAASLTKTTEERSRFDKAIRKHRPLNRAFR
ncbi:DNA-binding protein [Nevskia ramosa]|uniref:DNA-binding protein n=1 Tax=Nevskia ramosa TaxID=64002 RepID=UPI0023567BEA|nr:DNA-binding protein [Nevskia ramosa]